MAISRPGPAEPWLPDRGGQLDEVHLAVVVDRGDLHDRPEVLGAGNQHGRAAPCRGRARCEGGPSSGPRRPRRSDRTGGRWGESRLSLFVRRVLDDPVFGSKDATHELVESRWTTS